LIWFNLPNICLGAAAVGYRTESLHGVVSPQAQYNMIGRQGNIQGKKELAKNITDIVSDKEMAIKGGPVFQADSFFHRDCLKLHQYRRFPGSPIEFWKLNNSANQN
jgi:hypothetical protein